LKSLGNFRFMPPTHKSAHKFASGLGRSIALHSADSLLAALSH
jgi:hypothetical protein